MAGLDEVLANMAEHARTHPEHGWNCACKDSWLREARRIMRDAPEGALDELFYVADVLRRNP